MRKLTLVIYDLGYAGVDQYLESIAGVKEVKVSRKEYLKVDISYDEKVVSIKILKLETLLYLDLVKLPSLVGFDKHYSQSLKTDTYILKDYCCEYCVKSMIESLLDVDGISAVAVDNDINNASRILKMKITYNSKIITFQEIKDLIKKEI